MQIARSRKGVERVHSVRGTRKPQHHLVRDLEPHLDGIGAAVKVARQRQGRRRRWQKTGTAVPSRHARRRRRGVPTLVSYAPSLFPDSGD